MATENYKISQLISQIAGDNNYRPEVAYALQRLMKADDRVEYEIALKEVTDQVNGYDSIPVAARKDYGTSAQSNLVGVPLFQPLTLSVENEPDLLLESAVVDLSMPRNIVSTVIQGRDSSVDEFINNGDIEINVSGVLCSTGYEYPVDQIVEFMKFMKQPSSLRVTHEVLNALGVYEIVVLQPTLDKSAYVNLQPYSFTAKEHVPLELNTNELSSLTQ